MKKYLLIAIWILFIFAIGLSGTHATTDYWIKVKLIGCAGKPYANQTIQLQENHAPETYVTVWTNVATFKTDSNGEIFLSNTDKSKYDINKHHFRFYWQKSDWVYSYVWLSQGSKDYTIGYTGGVDTFSMKSASTLNKRIVAVAEDEFGWSNDHYNRLLLKANKINDKQVLINLIVDLSTDGWTDPRKKIIMASLGKYDIVKLRQQYVDIQSDIDNSRKYRRSSTPYALWCTAFTTYVLREAGGPKLVKLFSARKFGDWFKQNSTVSGQDGEKYNISYISVYDILSSFKTTKSPPLKTGNFYLEEHNLIEGDIGGHSAIVSEVADFPKVTIVTMAMPNITVRNKVIENGYLTIYGAGKLECVQSP